jgi:hypothetical protein
MKKLELNQMEGLEGGGWLNGLCAITGLADEGIAVRYLVGNPISLTPAGATILAVATIACVGNSLGYW